MKKDSFFVHVNLTALHPFPAGGIAPVMGQPQVNLQPDAPANETKELLPVSWTKT